MGVLAFPLLLKVDMDHNLEGEPLNPPQYNFHLHKVKLVLESLPEIDPRAELCLISGAWGRLFKERGGYDRCRGRAVLRIVSCGQADFPNLSPVNLASVQPTSLDQHNITWEFFP